MARAFDRGSSEYLQIASPVVSAAPLTVSAWFNTADSSNTQTIFSIGDTGLWSRWDLTINGADQRLSWRATDNTGGGGTALTAASAVVQGTWQHGCGIDYASNDRAVLIGGGGKGTNNTARAPISLDITTIGAQAYVYRNNYFDGYIGEVAVWNVALSDLEVWLLGQGVPAMLIRPESLIPCWPLIDSDRDVLERGYHMTAYNTPSWHGHPRKVLDQYAKWQNRAGLRVPYRGRLAGRFNVPWNVRAAVTAEAARVPRPSPAYNNLAIY